MFFQFLTDSKPWHSLVMRAEKLASFDAIALSLLAVGGTQTCAGQESRGCVCFCCTRFCRANLGQIKQLHGETEMVFNAKTTTLEHQGEKPSETILSCIPTAKHKTRRENMISASYQEPTESGATPVHKPV